jgi:hypothetical protein
MPSSVESLISPSFTILYLTRNYNLRERPRPSRRIAAALFEDPAATGDIS